MVGKGIVATALALAVAVGAAGDVKAEEAWEDKEWNVFGLDLSGSLGKDKFQRYVPPVSNIIYNETPYITTEANLIFAYHHLPNDFITGGGDAYVAALQARIALTERLAFIATKDGYSWFQFDNVLPDTEGYNNIALGLKYNFLAIPESETLVTAGLRYEIPIGDIETGGIELAGDGDGFLNPFVTAATTFGDFGIQGSVGANFALDPDVDNSFVHYSLHADYEVLPGFFPLVEMNGYTAFNTADRLTGPLANLDGADLLNFGSEDRGTTITLGGGFRYRFSENFLVGAGVQTAVTADDDSVFGTRMTSDAILHF